MQGRDQGAGVLNIECRFSGDTVRGEEIFDGGAEELAVDEELKRDRLFGVQEGVYEFGEVDAAERCGF